MSGRYWEILSIMPRLNRDLADIANNCRQIFKNWIKIINITPILVHCIICNNIIWFYQLCIQNLLWLLRVISDILPISGRCTEMLSIMPRLNRYRADIAKNCRQLFENWIIINPLLDHCIICNNIIWFYQLCNKIMLRLLCVISDILPMSGRTIGKFYQLCR